uniref:Flagellar assembly protein T N-terminal domain-containing protein n=1 Tax=candidate division WOR-3 bacterium TaxID=2052148 RepID=A0A7C4CBN3_UNCW3
MNRLAFGTAALAAALLLAGCVYPGYTATTRTTQVWPPPGEVIVSGGEGTEVLAEGAAAITAGPDIARDQALKDALRKAVEQGVGTYVNSETRVQNFQLLSDRIYSQASGYVSSYRIISESRESNLFRVAIRAKVKLDRIEDDLEAIGILVAEQGRPRLMVLIKEVTSGAAATLDRELVETALVAAFQARGFPVVDQTVVEQNLTRDQLRAILAGDNQTALAAGLRTGAEIVVAGTMDRSREVRRVPYTQSETEFHKVRISARAVSVQTAEVLAASTVARELPFSADQAIEAAADSTGKVLMNRILAGWKKRTNITQLHIQNADNSRVEQLKAEIMTKVRGVTAVISRELVGTHAVVEVVSETSTQEILQQLTTRGLAIGFSVEGYSGNRIDLRLLDR